MGQGYVGLPLAMAAVNAGHTVTGYEPDKQRLDQLREGRSYVEDIPDKELRAALDSRRYMPTRSEAYLADFDVAVITVPTPLTDRQPDLRHVREATTVLARHLKAGALVVLESTTHPGTTRDVVVPVLEQATGWTAGADFHVGFSPERIDPGNRVWTFENTPKIVAGLTPRCRDKAEEFYRTVTKNVVLADALEEAELAKVFENTYRQVNIALVNELQRLAHVLGVDVWRTLGLADSKPFGFTRFLPGPGVGGHCLPVDPVFLSHHTRTQHGETFRIVELAQDINDSQPAYVVQRLQDTLNGRFHRGVYGARILALGLAYKAGTADHRESPAAQVVSLLESKGALVDCLDPHVPPAAVGASPKVFGPHTTPPWPLRDYDAVVLLTPHDEFDLQHIAAEAAYVLDTRGVMPDAPNIERL
ncbi:nucleotide sugar dehydrogenase [Streptomyces sp. NBC_00198]|uniref:nucleotide sugar dehydrogenase n=1 Tax=Streptomyces sp. NBC_00198 TaxID=2975677 RepID=UPI0022521092|nr:nucleotide sugar dehydrogenase [Streptomyces sp. NBC_00198]MCX5285938.1 nucleotide sugar dehydrogenase [Streptomyces sp. NBC_00198]MCX5286247.1 nucleotide sugar dehydrogenase [Streptomyces sp. NBC_00198]